VHGRSAGQAPTVYRNVLGYARCVTEVLLQPDAIYPHEIITRIRFAFAANPDRCDRSAEMETFTSAASSSSPRRASRTGRDARAAAPPVGSIL
jgi:hypothetical protein